MECRLARPEWCVHFLTKRSTGGHIGIGNCGQRSSGTAACPRHLYPVSSMNVPKMFQSLRQHTLSPTHATAHASSATSRESILPWAVRHGPSKCEMMRSRIGKVKGVSSQSGNYKHCPCGPPTCFVIRYQTLESTFTLQLHLVPCYSDRIIARC